MEIAVKRVHDLQSAVQRAETEEGKIAAAAQAERELTAQQQEFKKFFDLGWKVASHVRRCKAELSDQDFARHFDKLVVNAESSRKAIREEVYRIRGVMGHVTTAGVADVIAQNSQWIRNYSTAVFADLFGQSYADYLKSADFIGYINSQPPPPRSKRRPK